MISASHIIVWIVQNDYERILNCEWPNILNGLCYLMIQLRKLKYTTNAS